MPQVASASHSYAVKPAQSQSNRASQAQERPQTAFESMIDDNAAQAPAPKDQGAAARSQNNPPPKAKPGNSASEAKPAAAQAPAKAQKADKAEKADPAGETSDTGAAGETAEAKPAETETPVIETKTSEDIPGAPVTDAVADKTDPAVAQDPAAVTLPGVTPAVVVPLQPAAPAEVQQVTVAAEAAQAPVIAAVAGQQKPADAIVPQDKEPQDAEAGKDQPAEAAPATDGDETAGKKAAPPQPAEGKAAHAASHADKEHIARARGEGPDTIQRGGQEAAPADTAAATPKGVTDLPPPHMHAPTHATPGAAASPAVANAAAPQNAPQVPVPLSGVPVEIATKAREGKTNFDIRLDPPELGRIEVRLNIDRDGNVTSRLIADRQETLDLFRRDPSGLERALQDAGLKTSDNTMQFSLRDQSLSQQHDNTNKNSADTAHMLAQDDTLATIDTPVHSYGRLAGRGGGLDIRV